MSSRFKKYFKLKIIFYTFIAFTTIFLLTVYLIYSLKPRVSHNINYGVTFSNKYAHELELNWQEVYLKMLDDLGVKNLRLIAYWDDIEKTNDEYDFTDIKWQLEEANKRNVNVILTLGRKVPRWPECFEPEWYKKLNDDNVKEVELLDYIKTTVNELKNYENIKMWQVENEPFFPFGICDEITRESVKKEIAVVRAIDSRPILVQDSGEGGLWKPTYNLGDYQGISMYRKIWFDFWNVFLGRSIYFKYPLPHWSYKLKADLLGIPQDKIIVTELQAEPWGPVINSKLTTEQKNKTMSRNDFLDTISYAQKSGFSDLYLWGVEWWYWEKTKNNNPFYWDTARAIFN